MSGNEKNKQVCLKVGVSARIMGRIVVVRGFGVYFHVGGTIPSGMI